MSAQTQVATSYIHTAGLEAAVDRPVLPAMLFCSWPPLVKAAASHAPALCTLEDTYRVDRAAVCNPVNNASRSNGAAKGSMRFFIVSLIPEDVLTHVPNVANNEFSATRNVVS